MVSLKRNLRKFLYNLSIINHNLIYYRSNIFQDYRSLQNLSDFFISCSRQVFCKCFLFCYNFLWYITICFLYFYLCFSFLSFSPLFSFLLFYNSLHFDLFINNYFLSNKSWNQNWNIFSTALTTAYCFKKRYYKYFFLQIGSSDFIGFYGPWHHKMNLLRLKMCLYQSTNSYLSCIILISLKRTKTTHKKDNPEYGYQT